MELFMIALRNVFRNPRRTILNLVAIGLGAMIILTMKGWIGGLAATAYATQIDLDTAHVQVLDSRYEDEARRLPLDLDVHPWTKVRDAVTALPGVVGVSGRIDFSGQISNGETAFNVSFRGVDPEGADKVGTLRAQIKQGTWFADDGALLLGSGLAKKLGVKVGDQVFLTALDRYGVRNLVDGKVGAIFTSGFGIFDDGVVFTTLKKAQDTLAMDPEDVTRVVIRFRDINDLNARVAEIATALEAHGLGKATGLRAYPWREFAKTLVDTIESRIKLISSMLTVLVLLVAVGILNSMSMSVQERYQEIGTLRAIGMNRRKMQRLFMAEGFLLGTTGGLVGLAGAGILAYLGLTYGIDVRGFLPREVPIPLVSVMHPVYSWFDFPMVAVFAGLVATLGSILPARRAGRLVIRDALGSHV